MESTEKSRTFIDELLEESEAKESNNRMAYFDFQLLKICELEKQIAELRQNAEEEIELINQWAETRIKKIQKEIGYYASSLESYLRELDKKTFVLPHGTLKFRKKSDKVEISDMDAFLSEATVEMIQVIPEQIKANLQNLKKIIKQTGLIPKGVNLIEGETVFSYKLNKGERDNDTETKT